MQKKRKILISIALSVGLALTATQVSNNGGLQSNTLAAALYSCKSGAITSAERCRTPLTTDKARVEREIAVLARSIQTKKTECSALKNRKRPQTLINSCTKQLTNLEKNNTTKKRELAALTLSLSKLVSEAPLQVRVVNVQREINTVRAQIVTKTAECGTLRTQRKTAQMNACAQQLTALRQTETVKKKELTVAKESLKKVAGVTSIIVKIPAPTPATTRSVTPPVLNSAPVQRAPTQPVTNANTETVIPPIASTTSTASIPTPVASPVPITTEATSTSLRPTITVLNTANTPTPTTVVTISAPPVVTPPVAAIRPNNTPSNPGAFINQGVTPPPISTSTAPVTPNNPPQTPQSSTPLIIDDRNTVTAPGTRFCTDNTAINFGGPAPCVGGTLPVYGCNDMNALNNDLNVTHNDGSCRYPNRVCGIPGAHNYTQPDTDNVESNDVCMTCYDDIKNGDEENMDCGGSRCQACMRGCMDPKATNYNSSALVDDGSCSYTYQDDYSRPPREICKDEQADNYEAGEVEEPDTVNNDICIYCDLPKKIEEIRNKQGAKVKTSLSQLNQEDKDACKKQICESGTMEGSTACTIDTVYKPQYAYLQMYLYLSGQDPGVFDGIYRSAKDITSSPTTGSNTRKALAQYGSSQKNLNEMKNCVFVKNLLQYELIKDYKKERTDGVKVAQMSLAMRGEYSGQIDGDPDKTYDLLQKHYKWTDNKFGIAYIAGEKWQVARATRFGYQDSGDNGRGSPFMDPAGKGISTNNSSIQGASLPLPVTVRLLCPNIVTEVSRYVDFVQRGFEPPKPVPVDEYIAGLSVCNHMLGSADPLNPSSYGNNLSGLGVLAQCITIANKAGFTNCRDAHHKARVRVSSIGNSIIVPLVDIGPSESVWRSRGEAVIDLTYSAMRAISGNNALGTNYETCFDITTS